MTEVGEHVRCAKKKKLQEGHLEEELAWHGVVCVPRVVRMHKQYRIYLGINWSGGQCVAMKIEKAGTRISYRTSVCRKRNRDLEIARMAVGGGRGQFGVLK